MVDDWDVGVMMRFWCRWKVKGEGGIKVKCYEFGEGGILVVMMLFIREV